MEESTRFMYSSESERLLPSRMHISDDGGRPRKYCPVGTCTFVPGIRGEQSNSDESRHAAGVHTAPNARRRSQGHKPGGDGMNACNASRAVQEAVMISYRALQRVRNAIETSSRTSSMILVKKYYSKRRRKKKHNKKQFCVTKDSSSRVVHDSTLFSEVNSGPHMLSGATVCWFMSAKVEMRRGPFPIDTVVTPA